MAEEGDDEGLGEIVVQRGVYGIVDTGRGDDTVKRELGRNEVGD